MYRGEIRNIHFVGIGGSGMSGISEVLLSLGYNISGSDIRRSDVTDRLKRLGISVYIGHSSDHVIDANVVVYSSAINIDNVEVIAARDLQIPVIPRAEMLAELMRMKHGIAVAGTHGKTTTTSMIASVLTLSGIDPTVVIGGRLNSFGSNAKLGEGDYLVAEADESDGSFIKLSPTIAVVTGIDREHMDYYKGMDDLRSTYLDFINRVPFYGCAVLCMDNENVQSIMPGVTRRYITYGLSAQSDVSADSIRSDGMLSQYQLRHKDCELGTISISMPGKHNVYNSLAAAGVGLELGLSYQEIRRGLESFSGVDRRFQLKASTGGTIIIDDYGHHPDEIKATLKAAKCGWKKRLIVVFQPHRFSRTKDLFESFLTAFYDADKLILTDIYAAGEDAIPGVSSSLLFEGIRAHGHRDVVYIPHKDDIPDYLKGIISDDDMIITLGAGDIGDVSDMILEIIGLGKREIKPE